MKLFKVLILLSLACSLIMAQEQSIRGQIIDSDSKFALMYVSIAVLRDSVFIKGIMTDSLGNFRVDHLQTGKYIVKTSYIGYFPLFRSGVTVNSGKETILILEIEENRNNIREVEINGIRKDQTVNEMSMISTRTFSVEEANRYAGSRGDPGRMASNFAGVQGSDDSRNDIVIRGNSPLGVVWRINGIDIANPNHFAIPGTTGGGVTMLNSKTLDNSDFLTGAFSAEYGNTVAGIFDLKLRNGNNEKHEFTGQFGFLGTELTGEGPLSKRNHSSYLLAYRYSTLKLFDSMNIKIGTEAIPNYQDLTFKLNFPGRKGGNFFVYGIGGTSDINIKVSEQKKPEDEIYGEKGKDQLFKTSAGIFGIGKSFSFNSSAYAQIKLSFQKGKASADDDLVYRNASYDVDSIIPCLGYTFLTDKTSLTAEFVKKIIPASTLKGGINIDFLGYNLVDSVYNELTNKFITRLDYNGSTWLIQPYLLAKYKLTDNINLTAGIHTQFHLLNNSSSYELRTGVKYLFNNQSALSLGFGMHSQMQPYYIYYYQIPNGIGQTVQPNINLSFTRSNHYILGYDKALENNSRIKIEAYYMYLYHVPVTRELSSYSILNEGASFSRFFPGNLVNEGSGYNTGIEFTYEKFFSRNFYVLFTASLFDSKYKGSDGILRNTSFAGKYAVNLLAGKDYKLSGNASLTTSFKITWAGGKRYSPVDTAASNLQGELVEVDSLRNSLQFKDYFRCDLKIGLKINSRHFTHEFAIDLVNVFGNKNILSLTYVYDPRNPQINPVKEEYQLGFLPIFYYKVDF